MYREFARFYDELMSDYDYDAWSARVRDAVKSKLPIARKGLDLACGSGNFTLRLARDFDMMGSDVSEEMLGEAMRKAHRGVTFFCQGVNDTELAHPVDFMTIMCDGVNYCLEGIDFGRLARNLVAGGVLIFDISSPHRLVETLGDNLYYEDRDDVTYFWQNRYDEALHRVYMDLTFFVPSDDGRYGRFDEEHIMRVYTIAEISAAASPFFEIEVYGNEIGSQPAPSDDRIHFVCVKK